jgi:hypothetical protein
MSPREIQKHRAEDARLGEKKKNFKFDLVMEIVAVCGGWVRRTRIGETTVPLSLELFPPVSVED